MGPELTAIFNACSREVKESRNDPNPQASLAALLEHLPA